MDIYTVYRIYSEGKGYLVEYESNDDNDDGYDDSDTARGEYRVPTLERAFAITGKHSRIGMYGQPVNVYLDGKLI